MIATLEQPVKQSAKSRPPSFLEQAAKAGFEAGFYEFPNNTRTERIRFNCAYTKWAGCDWLVTRNLDRPLSSTSKRNSISFWRMENNVPLAEFPVKFKQESADEQFEDPRIICSGGLMLLSYVNMRPRTYAHQAIGEVNLAHRVDSPIHIVYGNNRESIQKQKGHEKNWVWFWHGNDLMFSYTMQPHVVCRVENQSVVEQFKTDADLSAWKYGLVRGGSPPIQIGNENLIFFHSSLPWIHPYREYFMGAACFEAKPPFKLTRITNRWLLRGSEKDPMLMNPQPITVFPMGSALDGDKLLVTAGCNDCRSIWCKIPIENLFKRMVTV